MGVLRDEWLTASSGQGQHVPDPRVKKAEMEAGPGFEGLIGLDCADITPVDLLPLNYWGSWDDCQPEGFLGRMWAYCLTLQKAKTDKPLVLITLDLGPWPSPEFSKQMRSVVCKWFGLPDSHLIIQTTGVFASPDLDATRIEGAGNQLDEYLGLLETTILKLVTNTLVCASWGMLEWATGTCGLATNTDIFVADDEDAASSYWAIGAASEAYADKTLLVGRVSRADGTSGTLVNYACWPATLAPWARQMTADYPGPMRQLVETATGGPCMFLQGAAGDQGPAFMLTRNEPVVEKNGRELGYAVLSVLAGMPPAGKRLIQGVEVASDPVLMTTSLADASLAAGLSAKTLHIRVNLKDTPTVTRAIDATLAGSIDEAQIASLQTFIMQASPIHQELKNNNLSIWIWNIGGAALVAAPVDAYARFQERLRSAFWLKHIVCLSNANGSFGALVPDHMYRSGVFSVENSPFMSGTFSGVTRLIIDEIS